MAEKHACVEGLVDAELAPVRSLSVLALSESEGTANEAICNVLDGFPVEGSSDAPGSSAGGVLQPSLELVSCVTISFCLDIVNVIDSCISVCC